MWAGELFKAFLENDINKENNVKKFLPLTTLNSLKSIKNVYKNRKKQGMTPFIAAILHKDVELCEKLIEEGIDFGQQGRAVVLNETKFVQFNNKAGALIILGPNDNVFKDFKKTTPMFWAIKCGLLPLIDKLISSGHKINGLVEKLSGMPAFSFSVLSGNIPVVKHFLLNQPCDIHENSILPDIKPLDVAISSGDSEMVELIFKHGDNPNCANHHFSPLSQAVFFNKRAMVALILSLGADINFGLETGSILPPLNIAIYCGNFDIAQFLIQEGADVKAKDSKDNTALHMLLTTQIKNSFFSHSAFLPLVQLLINKGAQVDIANKNGVIPLIQAIVQLEPELVDILLSTPVNLNTMLNLEPKETFLHIAVSPPSRFGKKGLEHLKAIDYWEKRCRIVQSLLKKGADVNVQSGDGRTPLHYAAESGNVKLVKLLLESEVDINKVAADGMVALHYAVYNGSYNVIKLMLESGAKVDIKNNFGLSPLSFGLMEKLCLSCDTIKLLIDYGADIYSQCLLNSLSIYDVAKAQMKTDRLKLFWREGYPYDYTKLQFTTNLMENMLYFFKKYYLSGKHKNILTKINVKQMEKILKSQIKFINGVEKNNVKMVLRAISEGAEVGGCSVINPFPLHFLAKNGFTDVAEILLNKGIKPNTKDSEGKLPIDLAVEFGHFKMYVALLQYGACYNRTAFDKSLFLREGNSQHHKLYLLLKKSFKCVKQGDISIIKNLNKYWQLKNLDTYHALLNCVDEKGRTLLALAVERGKTNIVQKLLEYRLKAFEAI